MHRLTGLTRWGFLGEMTNEQIHSLITAVSRIANGDVHGATGLEALTMAIGGTGEPGEPSVASALHAIADALIDVSRNHEEVASAIRTSNNGNDAVADAIIYMADRLRDSVYDAAEKLSLAIESTIP